MSGSNNVALAIARATSAISPKAPPRQRFQSKNHNKRIRQTQAFVPLTPTYHPPLLTTHYIPPHHVPPPLQHRVWPSPYECVQRTRLRELVSPSETYDIPEELPDKFAIIAPDNYKYRQYKVMSGDRIMISLYENKETGRAYQVDDKVIFDNVLLVGSREHTLIGRPLIPGVTVEAVVDEITQLVKKRWIWKRMRKRKQKIIGFRDWVTILRIQKINCDFINYLSKEQLNKLYKKMEPEDRILFINNNDENNNMNMNMIESDEMNENMNENMNGMNGSNRKQSNDKNNNNKIGSQRVMKRDERRKEFFKSGNNSNGAMAATGASSAAAAAAMEGVMDQLDITEMLDVGEDDVEDDVEEEFDELDVDDMDDADDADDADDVGEESEGEYDDDMEEIDDEDVEDIDDVEEELDVEDVEDVEEIDEDIDEEYDEIDNVEDDLEDDDGEFYDDEEEDEEEYDDRR